MWGYVGVSVGGDVSISSGAQVVGVWMIVGLCVSGYIGVCVGVHCIYTHTYTM